MNDVVSRPALRYMGGKWRLAPWIVSHFPPHRIYVEPYAGGASVLLRKPRSYAEVYNDLDGEVVNLFRILRDPGLAARLINAIALTPFAREEFDEAHAETSDTVEMARRLVIRSFMSHGSTAATTWHQRRSGFRAASNRNGTTPAHDWANLPDGLLQVTRRLRGIVIENRPALDIIRRFDAPDVLFYVDPPYLHETRSGKRAHGKLEHAYAHEMSPRDHIALIRVLRRVRGMVVLSGYPSRLYDKLLRRWDRAERDSRADGALPRREVLWMNPAASRAHGLLGGMMRDTPRT